VVVVAEATTTAYRTVMHPRQLEDLAFLTVLKLGEVLRTFTDIRIWGIQTRLIHRKEVVLENDLLCFVIELQVSTLGFSLHSVKLQEFKVL
jgi:hypothetical protein